MYCSQTGLNCENANSYGACLITGCTKHMTVTPETNLIYPVQAKESNISISTFTRRCEICDSETEDINHHLCPRCRLKLHDLLYNDPNWGKGG